VAERKFHLNSEAERQNLESHVTELHYVIAELKREINILKQRRVMEEEGSTTGEEEEGNSHRLSRHPPSPVTSGKFESSALKSHL